MSDYLYHATFRSNLNEILENGLIAGKRKNFKDSKKAIYLADDISLCIFMMRSYKTCGYKKPELVDDDLVILKINMNDIDTKKLKYDSNLEGHPFHKHSFEYRGVIAPYLIDVQE